LGALHYVLHFYVFANGRYLKISNRVVTGCGNHLDL